MGKKWSPPSHPSHASHFGSPNQTTGHYIRIMVTLTTAGFESTLARVRNAPRQIQFATVKAINETATAIQKGTVERLLPDAFTLRAKGRPWQQPGGPLGWNIRPFAKTSQPEPFAVVGSRAEWLKLQEEGGTKRAGNGKSLALPIRGTARPTPTSVIARRNKPAALLARKGFFLKTTKRGDHVIMQRIGKRERAWFTFERSARIPAILHFRPFALATATRTLSPAFTKHLRAALQTAR